MDIRVLGPVEAVDGDRTIAIASRYQRGLLALLALEAGRIVATSRIVADLWGDESDADARNVAFHVTRLRDALAPGRSHGDPGPIATEPLGYALRVDPGSVDAVRFERLLEEARSALGERPSDAVERLSEALALWRGAALEGLGDLPFVAAAAHRLDELRQQAVEDRVEARLAVGDAAALVPDLRRLVADEPLRERRRGQLMLALYRSGRQADALQAYRETRATLADELGLDPSPELQELERAILRQDPTLLVTGGARTTRRNPYKGLRPFAEEDAAEFYGREALVARLRERLDEVARAGRCLLLVGPSGSGKSSLLRAGLLPVLRAKRAATAGSDERPAWWIASMSPGTRPLEELAACLRPVGPADRDAGPEAGAPPSPDALAADASALARHLAARPATSGRPLLVVDQLEELWVDAVTAKERIAFVAAVVEALDDSAARLVLLASIRADALDRPLQDRLLGPRIGAGIEPVTPLQRPELERAVVRPAASVGAALETGLLDVLVADAMARPGALPLLQYALTELYERSDGRLLTHADREAIGGVGGAVAGSADRVFDGLPESDRPTARRLFLRLVALDPERAPRSRRVDRAALTEAGGGAAAVDRVVEAFAGARLLTLARDPDRGAATVEVAHEALLARWPRLVGWIEEEREALWTRGRLDAAASEWAQAGREPAYLLTGSRLELFRSWAATTDLRLDRLQREYLAASAAEAQRAADAETARLEHERRLERRATRVLRALVAVLAVAAVVSTGLLALVWRQGEIAAEERAVATARELAVASAGWADSDSRLARLLAIESARATADRGWITGEAMDALHWAIQGARVPYPAGDPPAAVRAGPTVAQGVFLLPIADLVSLARDGAGPTLTAAECRTYLHLDACPPDGAAWATSALQVRTQAETVAPEALAAATLSGTHVRVASQLPVDLAPLIGGVSSDSGVSVDVAEATTLGDLEGADLAIVDRPADIRTLAQAGTLIAIDAVLDTTPMVGALGERLADAGVVRTDAPFAGNDGVRYGIPVAVSMPGLLWYPANAFAQAGYGPPATGHELAALTERMIRDGRAPWCLGLLGSPDGADAAGWLMDLVLARLDPQAADRLADGRLSFDSGPLRDALHQLAAELRRPQAVTGGLAAAFLTPESFAPLGMLRPDGPGCWLLHGPSTIRSALPASARGALSAIPLPVLPDGSPSLRVRAYSLVVLRDRPEVRAIAARLVSPGFATALAGVGGGLLPTSDPGAEAFVDPLEAALDRGFRAAIPDGLVIDPRDRMPGTLGTVALPAAVMEYLRAGGGRDDEAVLKRVVDGLERARSQARDQAP